MEQNLEEVFEQTDDIIDTAQQQPPPARPSSSREKSLQEKLYDIYIEECGKDPVLEGLRNNVNLLEKLMKRESLPCLVVNLYPENQGYSLMLKDKEGVLVKTLPVTYIGQKLLEYLDAEELPSFLIDVLEKSPVNVFHRGCVIAEIRDYRQSSDTSHPEEPGAEPTESSPAYRQSSDTYPPGEPGAEPTGSPPVYQTRYTLLRPTMQSLVSDVECISSDNSQWTQEEKLELESQLLLATSEPLCLDPSVAVTCTANRLLFNDQMMTDPRRQRFTSHDWPCLQLPEKQNVCTTPPDVETMIACRKRAEMKAGSQYDLKIAETRKYVDTWKQRPCELVAPSEVNVQKYARGKQSMPRDDSESTSRPDPGVKYGYLFDFEEGSSQSRETKSSVTQSISDPISSFEIGPPTEGRHDRQKHLPQVAPSDCLPGSVAGEQIQSGKAMGVYQGSVQSKAEFLGKKKQEGTGSICLGQPSPRKKAKSHSLISPVLEKKVKTPASLFTLPSTSGQGSSVVSPPSVSVRGRKLPRLAPYIKSASLPQQTFQGVRSTHTTPPVVQPSVSSSESCPSTQGPSSGTAPNVINLFGLSQGISLLQSPSQVQSFPTSAPALTKTSSRGFLPPSGQMPSTQTGTPQHSVQTPMQFILKNTSCPVTVALPPGSVILHPQSQTQQLQSWFRLQQPQQQSQPQPQLYSQAQLRQLQSWFQPKQPQQQSQSQSQSQPQPQPQPQLYSLSELRQLQSWLQPQQPQQQSQPQPRLYLQPELRQLQAWLQPQQPQQQSQPQPRLYLQPELRQLQAWLQPQQPQQQSQPQPRLYLQPELRQLQAWLQPQQPQQLQHAQVYSQPKVQQPQHTKPLYLLIPKQQQPPKAPAPPQPVPPSYQCTQSSSFQQWAMSTQQTGLFNLAEAGRVCQPQATMVCQVGSTQSPGQSLPSQSFQHPADQVAQLQAQSQTVQLRLMSPIMSVPRAPTQHSHQGHTENQYKGKGRGGPPTTPKS